MVKIASTSFGSDKRNAGLVEDGRDGEVGDPAEAVEQRIAGEVGRPNVAATGEGMVNRGDEGDVDVVDRLETQAKG